eukprot:m.385361 g.385361  ORF g.385361 m.385361 type:complete len:211 (-) comp21006_c0_seq11:1581-2213(-)
MSSTRFLSCEHVGISVTPSSTPLLHVLSALFTSALLAECSTVVPPGGTDTWHSWTLGKLCCHPTLVHSAGAVGDDDVTDDVTTVLAGLSLDPGRAAATPPIAGASPAAEQPRGVGSAKLDALANELRVLMAQPSAEGPRNKIVVVSQWTSYLDIIADAVLQAAGIRCVGVGVGGGHGSTKLVMATTPKFGVATPHSDVKGLIVGDTHQKC